jgi:hypothetical protein
MKFQKSLLLGLTTGVIALTATPTFGESSSASKVAFDCKTIENIPTTVAYNPENQEKEPISLISWKSEYIDSQNISQDCDRAAKTLGKRFELQNPFNSDIYLVVENHLLDENNSNNHNNKTIQTIVCLADERGGSCNFDRSNQLFSVKTKAQEQDIKQVLSDIVNSDFAQLDGDKIRGVGGRTYPKIKSRTWLDKLFSLKMMRITGANELAQSVKEEQICTNTRRHK